MGLEAVVSEGAVGAGVRSVGRAVFKVWLPAGGIRLQAERRIARVKARRMHKCFFIVVSSVGVDKTAHIFLENVGWVVPLTGIEPVRILLRGILSPLCLPVPPQRHGVILTHLLPSVKKNRLDKLWFPL